MWDKNLLNPCISQLLPVFVIIYETRLSCPLLPNQHLCCQWATGLVQINHTLFYSLDNDTTAGARLKASHSVFLSALFSYSVSHDERPHSHEHGYEFTESHSCPAAAVTHGALLSLHTPTAISCGQQHFQVHAYSVSLRVQYNCVSTSSPDDLWGFFFHC